MTMTESLGAIRRGDWTNGVMALFPFAASQMSQALISDRTSSMATSIDGFVRSYGNRISLKTHSRKTRESQSRTVLCGPREPRHASIDRRAPASGLPHLQ